MRPYSRIRVMSDRIGSFKDQATSPPPPPPPPPPAPAYPAPWAYYPLSANANDASGNGRNLTGTQGSYSGSGGVVSGYTTDDLSLTNAASASPSSWTFSAWMRPISEAFVEVTSSVSWESYEVKLASYDIEYTIQAPGYSNTSYSSVWKNVSASSLGGGFNAKAYVNGVLVSTTTSPSNNNQFSIANTTGFGATNGICEVAIWKDTALTALEIDAVYDKGVAGQSLV